MNILLTVPTYTPYIIGGIILLILLIVFILLIRKKPKKKVGLDHTYFDLVLLGLGGTENIIDLTREHQRLQVKVLNTKLVKAPLLQELKIPAFVKGKQITLLIKHHTEEVLSFINDKRKENN